jgi:Uma2 family endonuclease
MNSVQMAPLTVEDYRQLPETGPRYQLIEGDLFMAPAPNRFHQNISLNVAVILYKYLEKNPLGSVYTAPFDVYLDEINAVQPDVVFVSKGNDILTAQGVAGAPDFVVEVLSPKTAHLDKQSKRRVYARAGVKELWIIDPDTRTTHVYWLQKDPNKPAKTYGIRDTFTSPTFPGLKFKGTAIFKAQ